MLRRAPRPLTSVAIVIVTALALVVPTSSHAGLLDSLVGHWAFDGNGNDSSGNARDLDLFGGVGFATGLFGQALDLPNDTSKYAQRPVDDAVFNFGASDFTVQTWVNFNDVNSIQIFVEKFENPSGPGWTFLTLGDGRFQFAGIGGGAIDSASQSIATNTWHQLLTRRTGSTVDIFYDGVIIATEDIGPNTIPDTTNPLLFGRRASVEGALGMNGRLDEVAIWTRGLTNAEVAALYNDGQGTLIPTVTPHPATAILLFVGTGAVVLLRRRRQP